MMKSESRLASMRNFNFKKQLCIIKKKALKKKIKNKKSTMRESQRNSIPHKSNKLVSLIDHLVAQ